MGNMHTDVRMQRAEGYPLVTTLKHCGAASKYAIQMLYTSQSLKIL